MKSSLYSVYDKKAEAFGRLFQLHNDSMAIRSFTSSIVSADGHMAEYPEDYSLYRVGVFNDETGTVEGSEALRIITGLEAIKESRDRDIKIGDLEKQLAELRQLNGEDYAQ